MQYAPEFSAWKNVDDANVGHAMCYEEQKWFRHDVRVSELIGRLDRTRLLDYGCGIGQLAGMVQFNGGNVEAFDPSPVMQQRTAERIGQENVHTSIRTIQEGSFDCVVCCMVACIIPNDKELRSIFANIRSAARKDATIIVTVCNPRIFNVRDTVIDERFPTGEPYEKTHPYPKRKKEGIPRDGYYTPNQIFDWDDDDKDPYVVTEIHRPEAAYDRLLTEADLPHICDFYSHRFHDSPSQGTEYAFYKRTAD